MKIENPFRVIIFSVLAGHLLAILLLSIQKEPTPIPQRKKLRVSTVKLAKKQEAPAPPAPQKKRPLPKKQIVRKKKAAPKKKPTLSNKQKKLFEKARKKIAKLQTKAPSSKKNAAVPELKIESLSLEADDYTLISDALQNYLCLPEIGKVKISLTLTREGQVKSCKILCAESQVNEKYVEKTIKTVQFPSNKQEKTYTITLVNET